MSYSISKIFSIVAALIVLAASSVVCQAQTATTGLTGTVVDASGAAVSNAKVVLTSRNTGQKFETTTNTAGFYGFAGIPVGEYDVTVSETGKSDLTNQFHSELNERIANIDEYEPAGDVTVLFKFNSAKLTDDAKQQLDQLGSSKMGSMKRYFVAIQGFTDKTGTTEYNLELSHRRAEVVQAYLAAQHNIPVDRIQIVGLGKDKPVNDEKTRDDRQKNRRVEVTIFSADSGFKAQRIEHLSLGFGQETTFDVKFEGGGEHGVEFPAHRTFSDPIWNVWTEQFSTFPSYQPITPQTDRHDYSLVVNISALLYREFEKAVYSRSVSSSFSNWLEENKDRDSADVDVLILPDRRYFAPQLDNEKVKPLHIELAKVRNAQKNGFDLVDSPFNILRANRGDAPFSFGTQTFRVKTTSKPGNAPVALSIWVDGKPIDEISVSICIVAHKNDPCDPTPAAENTLKGDDLSGHGTYPDAALHLIDRQSDIVGIYRCNSCGWAKDDFRTWEIAQTARWFADRTKEILDLMTQPPDSKSKVTILQQFDQAGDNMRNVIFDSQDTEASGVKGAFADFVLSARKSKENNKEAPSLFVRLIPSRPELVLAPVNLMRLELADHSKEFIGTYVNLQSPLEFQDYSNHSTCISQWVLFVPPEKTPAPPALQAVSHARAEFQGWINTFQGSCQDCVKDSETNFQTWLTEDRPGRSEAILVLSHHSANSVFFYDGGSPAIQSTSITRSFGTPSLAIIAGCGTSAPGASEFIRTFNAHGVSSVIATSTEVEPEMAGQFLTILMDSFAAHAKESSYGLSKARFDAVTVLSSRKDKEGNLYGPRALAFILAGNGALRACVPSKDATK